MGFSDKIELPAKARLSNGTTQIINSKDELVEKWLKQELEKVCTHCFKK